MLKSSVSNILFILFCLMLIPACQQEKRAGYDRPLEEIISVNPAQSEQIYGGLKMGLLKPDEDWRRYMMKTGDSGFEQIEYVQTETEDGAYHFREIYNIYHDSSMAQLEVYVSEFRFRPDSLNHLYRQEDYRIVLKGDTAYIQEETFSYINPWRKKEIEVQGKSYPIFQIEGYSPMHMQTDLPSRDQPSDYLKFWNPGIGTILVFFGEGDDDQMFELQEVGAVENQDFVADLRREIVKAFRE